MAELSSDIRYLKGIGAQRAAALGRLGIVTLRDLICFFPRTYEDRTKTSPIAALGPGENACVRAIVATEPTLSRVRRGMMRASPPPAVCSCPRPDVRNGH